ncbi:MAG: class I SAM-dependent methyltransferase [Candidatus Hodarchaeota archaeon]
MKFNYQELRHFIRHPLETMKNIFKIIDYKFKLSRTAKILDGGERIIINNWDYAKDSNNIDHSIHIKRYEWVKDHLKNLKVLDNGCGTGYGTYFLAKNNVKEIIGIDISKKSIEYAQEKYNANNLKFKQMNSLSLDLTDDYFDAVISFDVIEHIDEKHQKKYLSEIIKVIHDDGFLIIGNPNAELSREKNPHHKKELTLNEFKGLLKLFFKKIDLFGEKFVVNGKNLAEKWFDYIKDMKYSNIKITKNECELSFNLLAICTNPIKRVNENYL